VRVAGAAPSALLGRLERVRHERGRGIVARLRRGPAVIFGGDARLGQKWRAAARVLADPASRGASYVDVRLPERPVAGGLKQQIGVTAAAAGPAATGAAGTGPQSAPATPTAPGATGTPATPAAPVPAAPTTPAAPAPDAGAPAPASPTPATPAPDGAAPQP
jgi:hypothetical protein